MFLRKLKKNYPVFLAVFFGATAAMAALLASANFIVSRVWVGGGGSKLASTASFRNTVSIAQPLAGPQVATANFRMRGGFIQSPLSIVAPGTVCTAIVNPLVDTVCTVTGPGGLITVRIPAGGLAGGTTLTVSIPVSYSPAGSNILDLNPLGLGVAVGISPSVALLKPYTITLTYMDSQVPQGREDRLRLAYEDSARNVWVPMAGQTDSAANTVTVSAARFATFQLFSVSPVDDLEKVLIFPNPFKPYAGHTQMVFSKLPEGAKVQIFTLTGELVRTLPVDGAGQSVWDVLNNRGEKVKSGIYVAIVQRGSDNRVMRIAVEK